MLNLSGKTKLIFNTFSKLILAVVISCAIMLSMLFVLFTPTYEVKMGDEILGYISDKENVQAQINDFLQNGDKENVGYVILKETPTYEFNFVRKDTHISDNEVLDKVYAQCEVYYRVYGVNVNEEEKFVVDTLKEAQEIVDQINEEQKDYQKKGTVEISEKFVKEYNLPEDITVAVNDIQTDLKEANDAYVKSIQKATTNYAAATTTSYVVPEEILLAMKEANANLSFRNPLEPGAGVVTSRFGLRSLGNHKGLDIGAPTGTEIHVAEDGIITYTGWYGGYGNLIMVQHANGYETYYGHCSSILCKAGDTVSKGDVIGLVGSTGRSTGPHCHFEVRYNGVQYDPEQFISE